MVIGFGRRCNSPVIISELNIVTSTPVSTWTDDRPPNGDVNNQASQTCHAPREGEFGTGLIKAGVRAYSAAVQTACWWLRQAGLWEGKVLSGAADRYEKCVVNACSCPT